MKKLCLSLSLLVSLLECHAISEIALVNGLPTNVLRGWNDTFTIQLINKGQNPITIDEVKPSCGCVAYLPPNHPITAKPNEIFPLTIHLDTLKGAGPIDKQLAVCEGRPNCVTRGGRIM